VTEALRRQTKVLWAYRRAATDGYQELVAGW
jgi:hypothetical protein